MALRVCVYIYIEKLCIHVFVYVNTCKGGGFATSGVCLGSSFHKDCGMLKSTLRSPAQGNSSHASEHAPTQSQ